MVLFRVIYDLFSSQHKNYTPQKNPRGTSPPLLPLPLTVVSIINKNVGLASGFVFLKEPPPPALH